MADVGEGPAPTPSQAAGGDAKSTKTEMQYREPKKSGFQKCCHFIYNKQTGFMGRSGLSWFKIFLFFIILYGTVFAFFFMMLFAVFQFVGVVDPESGSISPRLTGNHSLLVNRPGLGFLPRPDKDLNPDSALIWYDRRSEKEVAFFANQLKSVIAQEQNFTKVFKESDDIDYIDCSPQKKPENYERCKVYSDASNWGGCTEENKFGYAEGKPCVLIRLNKVVGWVPHEDNMRGGEGKELSYKIDEIPQEKLKMEETKDYVWLDCFGETDIDKSLVGDIMFYPTNRPGFTIPKNNFPFLGQKGYLAPFVMVQFQNPTPGTIIQIRCIAVNKNIVILPREGLGTVRFELLIDSGLADAKKK